MSSRCFGSAGVKGVETSSTVRLNALPPALGDFVRVVEKADTGVLTTNVDFPKMDEPNCDVAPKAGAAALLLSKPVS